MVKIIASIVVYSCIAMYWCTYIVKSTKNVIPRKLHIEANFTKFYSVKSSLPYMVILVTRLKLQIAIKSTYIIFMYSCSYLK